MSSTFSKDIPSPEDIAAEAAPQVCYDGVRKDYWIENNRGGWITVNETALRRYLKAAGVSADSFPGELSSMDRKLLQIQREQDIAFAGPIAGYPVGIHEMCGNRILVTSAAKLIQPAAGDWPLLQKLLKNVFKDPIYDQRPHVMGWLKVAVEALRANERRPGQALFIAGPRESGKSLVQNIVTEVFGGRAAKPYRYMTEQTPFNSELCGAEHLIIEDEFASTDMRTRRSFGARIKDFTVNDVQSLHPKGRPAVSVRPFRRLSVTLNDEPEDLLILPPIDESLEDKLMLLRAGKHPMPMPTRSLAERAAFWNALIAELPAFLWHLQQWSIPKPLRSERFGIVHYHHPELLTAITSLAPETRLLELIDTTFWAPEPVEARVKVKPPEQVFVTAVELERRLTNSELRDEARRLLYFPNAAGTYLGRLAQKNPERVKEARTAKDRRWRIFPPKE